MSFDSDELTALIPRLRRYAHALARHPVRPDDLVQDALERAWARRHQWRRGSDLRAWLFTILHNAFVSELRRHRVRGGDQGDALAFDEGAGNGALPMHDAASGGASSGPGLMLDVERALAALPVEQRSVVLLVGLEQLSYREAAEVLAIPVGTVMSRLARGRARLRDLMGIPASRADAGTSAGNEPSTLRVVR